MAFLDEVGLAELWSLISAKDEELGKAKCVSGSYTGTGKNGASNPSSLSFHGRPVRVQIESLASPGVFFYVDNLTSSYKVTGYYRGTSAYGKLDNQDAYTTTSYAKFDDATNTLYWYSTKDSSEQNNYSGNKYFYTAWFE